MFEAPAVVLAHLVVVAQQLVRAQHQLTKIDHAFALTLGFVQLVELNFFAGFRVTRFDVFGTQAVFLAARDEPHGLLGRKTLFVHLKLFAQAFDGA